VNLHHLSAGEIGAGIVLFGSVVAVLAGGWRWGRPRWKTVRRRVSAVLDSVGGRDEIIDPASGKVLAPALPAIGVRMADMEDWRRTHDEQMALLTEAVSRLADQGDKLAALERRVGVLESASAERVIGKVEAVKALDVIQAAMQSQPPIEGGDADEG